MVFAGSRAPPPGREADPAPSRSLQGLRPNGRGQRPPLSPGHLDQSISEEGSIAHLTVLKLPAFRARSTDRRAGKLMFIRNLKGRREDHQRQRPQQPQQQAD